MIKKISLLTVLFLIAVCGSIGTIWLSQEIFKTNVQNINDINSGYRLTAGFGNTSKVQEKSPTGALGTTVTTTLRADTPEKLTKGLTDLATDLNNASNDQLINVNLTIKYGDKNNQEFSLKFFPTTPGDYETENFTKIVNLFNSVVEKKFTNFTLTIYPITSGNYVIATGEDVNLEGDPSARQNDLISLMGTSLPVGYGNVFDVTYLNRTTAPDEEDKLFSIETFYTTEWSYNNALNVNYDNIEAFRTGKNSFVNATNIKFIRGEQPNTDQMVLVIPETDDAGLQSIAQQMMQRSSDKVVPPTSFTIYVRYAADGPDVYTFRNFYAY